MKEIYVLGLCPEPVLTCQSRFFHVAVGQSKREQKYFAQLAEFSAGSSAVFFHVRTAEVAQFVFKCCASSGASVVADRFHPISLITARDHVRRTISTCQPSHAENLMSSLSLLPNP